MGKILATLQQTDHSVKHPPPSEMRLVSIPADEEPAYEAGMPYIEIGPRREVEASADVLAAGSRPVSATSPSVLPRPHSVRFRNLAPAGGAELAPELVAYHCPGQPAAAQYGELLAALIDAAHKRAADPRVLLFTAAHSEAGCTTVLLNVAISAARADRKVVVVDANLRRAGIARKLALSDEPGLAEVLAGECSLDEGLRETAVESLTALTAGAPAPFLADVASLRALLAELRREFDLVLVDGPRWDSRAGCQALAGMCDAVFLVVPAGEADSPPTSELVRDLPDQGIALAGCVLTEP
jgi:Mrp family chromosome partitioning ATPase